MCLRWSMASTDREPGSAPRPNDTPELEDELRSIRAIGESKHAPDADDGHDSDDEPDEKAATE